MKNRELFNYLFFGILTTLVYFLVRFIVVNLTLSSIYAVVSAQLSAIFFAFFTNKFFVFNDYSMEARSVLSQFIKFLSGRLFVFLLDLVLTYIFIVLLNAWLIDFFSLKLIDYSTFKHFYVDSFLGSPILVVEFCVVLMIQIVAVILNYLISKYIVWGK